MIIKKEKSIKKNKTNKVTRYRIYILLEGQDVDCINVASLGGGIELDLGLTKDDEADKYDVYLPHTQYVDSSLGYWLLGEHSEENLSVVYIGNRTEGMPYYSVAVAVRPVIALPADVLVHELNGLWTIVD